MLYWFFGKFDYVNCKLNNLKKIDINTDDDCVFEFFKGKIRLYGHMNFSEKFYKERTLLISGNKSLIYWDLNKSILKSNLKNLIKLICPNLIYMMICMRNK